MPSLFHAVGFIAAHFGLSVLWQRGPPSFSPKLQASRRSSLDEERSHRGSPRRLESRKSEREQQRVSNPRRSRRWWHRGWSQWEPLQHPTGTDGCSTWSAEAARVLWNTMFFEKRGRLSFHRIWRFTLLNSTLSSRPWHVRRARYAPNWRFYVHEKWRIAPRGTSDLLHTKPV